MAGELVALENLPELLLVGIGNTLRMSLAKIVLRAEGDQSKADCRNFQLCAVH